MESKSNEYFLELLREFQKQNSKRYNLLKIGIWGSVAKNQFSEKSDVDVVVELKKQDLFVLIGIKQDLEEKFHRKVDVVSYRAKMNQFLKKRIDTEAIYV